MKKANATMGNTEQVDEFMEKLAHPFKKEVQMIREMIKKVNKDITEEIKWKAPSFSYKGESLVTFNLWEKERIHLVFHNPMISKVKNKLLEGDYLLVTMQSLSALPKGNMLLQSGKIIHPPDLLRILRLIS